MIIDISDGNQKNFFALQQISEWTAELRTTTSLRGRHGNYTLSIRAQDLGTPSHLVEEPIHICVTDFNDHPPLFVSPPHNSTLRVPEVNHIPRKKVIQSVFNRTPLLEARWLK